MTGGDMLYVLGANYTPARVIRLNHLAKNGLISLHKLRNYFIFNAP